MQPKKKVINITQAFGGVKTYIKYILEYCDREVFEFSIIAPDDVELFHFCENNNVKYYKININRELKPLSDINSLLKICKILRTNKYDIIHCHSAKGGFLGRLAGKFVSKDSKIIFTPNGFSYLSFTGIKRILFFLLECISKNWSDLLLSVSISESNRAIYEIGYKSEKVLSINNSILLENGDFERDYDKCVNIGTISRLTPQKNPLFFLKVALLMSTKYPKIIFKILGAGYHDHLANDVDLFIKENKLEDNVEIIKWGGDNSGIEFIKELDIFLLTSIFEGLPYSLLEAMASGLPCVTTKVDGNQDVIQNSINGFCCSNEYEFSLIIESLIENVISRKLIGNNAKSYIETHHNIVLAKEKFNNIYLS